MSKKLLTDDLILSKMTEDHRCLPSEDVDFEQKLQAIKDYYDFSISENWGNPDFMFYSETTADGYEIWTVLESGEEININDNVFYYEDGAVERVQELLIKEENITIRFWDDSVFDNIDFEEVEEELTDEVYEYSDVDELSDQWEELCLPNVKEEFESDGEIDVTARRESWNNFLDGLFQEGKISESLNEEGLPDEFEE